MKKLCLLLFALTLQTNSFAETCPSPADIRQGNFHDFRAYSNESGTPLNEEHLNRFKKYVAGFYSTRWLAGAFEGPAHCYYVNTSGKWTYAFLSKPGISPDFSSKAWYLDRDEPRCNTSLAACRFVADSKAK